MEKLWFFNFAFVSFDNERADKAVSMFALVPSLTKFSHYLPTLIKAGDHDEQQQPDDLAIICNLIKARQRRNLQLIACSVCIQVDKLKIQKTKPAS